MEGATVNNSIEVVPSHIPLAAQEEDDEVEDFDENGSVVSSVVDR